MVSSLIGVHSTQNECVITSVDLLASTVKCVHCLFCTYSECTSSDTVNDDRVTGHVLKSAGVFVSVYIARV